MSRHRSPGGRRAHRGCAPAATPRSGAPRRAPLVPSAQSALRNGVTAAGVAGGSLALLTPAVTLLTGPDPGSDAAVLRLAADESRRAGGASAVAAGYTGDATDGARMLASIVPVVTPEEPAPDQIDAAALLKAVGLADLVRKAEEERAAREAAARCDIDLSGLGRVKPWVAAAAQFLSCLYEHPDLIGVAGRGRVSDHPLGLALDLMVRGERGDRIAECALRNQEAFGITYVIWEQRINYGDGWQRMENRGNDTENHVDHVHISFARTAPTGTPTVALCS